MNNFEITSVAGKSVKLEFSTAEDAKEFSNRMELLKTKGYPMWVDDDVKQMIYRHNNQINNELLCVFGLAQGDGPEDKINAHRIIMKTIDHIKWLERFFYPIVMVDGEEIK